MRDPVLLCHAPRWALLTLMLGCNAPAVQSHPSTTPPARAPAAQSPAKPPPAATLRAVATYDDGAPASGALITITSRTSGKEVSVLAADDHGVIEATVEPGSYTLAVAGDRGFAWLPTANVPELDAKWTLSTTCRSLNGHVKASVAGTRVAAGRKSRDNGDIFVADVKKDGTFRLCLPDGYYDVELRGSMLSFVRPTELTASTSSAPPLEMVGIPVRVVQEAPLGLPAVTTSIDTVVSDVLASDARLIGLGEATHGTAELTTTRSALTFELIRRAGLRLVMVEIDAIAATAIDDYVTGANVDIEKAVVDLGFWITDTREFLQFLNDLRAYNATATDKVRVWGIDVQNTENPVALLLANAKRLKLRADDQAMLKQVSERRAAPIKKFNEARRKSLEALLARLSTPRSATDLDLRIAMAARSLVIQIGYLDGDTVGLYARRRDAGMAKLASYLVVRMGAARSSVWAHAAHIARATGNGMPNLGHHLGADASNRYYPIGFYVFEGSVRAWDAAKEVGVISHHIARAPDYTVEGAVMAATQFPDVAWLPLRAMPEALKTWFAVPRYVREVGATYVGEPDSMTLRAVSTEFDAFVVVKSGHDSTPTPTGERKVSK